MNSDDIFESMNSIDDEALERSERDRIKPRRRRVIPSIIAAALALAIVVGLIAAPGTGAPAALAFAVEAEYPDCAAYPDEADFTTPFGEFDYEAWEAEYDAWASDRKLNRLPEGAAAGLDEFFADSVAVLLSGADENGAVCSPLNIYMALAMLAEVTGGESRQQILDELNADSLEALREQAALIWRAHYIADGATTSVLAGSIWLDSGLEYKAEALEALSEYCRASSYGGEMGSEEFNEQFRAWINSQTGGLLSDQLDSLELDADTVMALVSTIYYRARWAKEFFPENNFDGVFLSPSGEVETEFMYDSSMTDYYDGDGFTAVRRALDGDMWLLLPDEGLSVDDILESGAAMEFILSGGQNAESEFLTVNLAMPKFDVSQQTDLMPLLESLGITDVMSPAADFSPLTDMDCILDAATHGARVIVDEEGVEAAAYTVMTTDGTAIPDPNEVDFTLDRPFFFAITSESGLPLFTGVVNRP